MVNKDEIRKQAEIFIMHNDEYSQIIIDGKIKEAAQLIVDFMDSIIIDIDEI